METLASGLHEGDWMMVAGEWRWSEASDVERVVARDLAVLLLSAFENGAGAEDSTLIAQVSAAYATPLGARNKGRCTPLRESRAKAKAKQALRNHMRHVEPGAA